MRVGNNPSHLKIINTSNTSHRVIIPVYIPNNEGYFLDSFNVFKICIESLLKTINSDTAISIISNGSSKEVNNYIYELYCNKKIDRAIFNAENLGKVNAIIAETRASYEPFITYSDADVFFDKGWLKKTFDIYKNFPKAGFVSMNPMPNSYGYASSAIIDTIFVLNRNRKLISNFSNFEDIAHFHKSVGRTDDVTKKLLATKALVLEKGEVQCFVGAGHFCCTIKNSVLSKYYPHENANASGLEKKFLDIPFEKTGYWRVSSTKAYVWHMGNVLEKDWSINKLNSISNFREGNFTFNELKIKQFWFSQMIPLALKLKIVSILKKIKII
jgi:hypothetical protein